jgi:hypothetical protein
LTIAEWGGKAALESLSEVNVVNIVNVPGGDGEMADNSVVESRRTAPFFRWSGLPGSGFSKLSFSCV